MAAVTEYCTVADLETVGLPKQFLDGVEPDRITDAIKQASAKIDSYLRARGYTLPLTRVGRDINDVCAALAAYPLAVGAGFNPAAQGDDNLRLRYEDAERWLREVAAGRVHPDLDDGAGLTGNTGAGAIGARIAMASSRGWSKDRNDTAAKRGAFQGD